MSKTVAKTVPTDKLQKRIESAGVQGIRRMKLRKEFGTKADKTIDELLSQGLIFADKKGSVITYWSKENYMQHLMATDPKFKLIYDMYSNANNKISNTISKITNDIDKKVSSITSEIVESKVSDIASEIDKKVSDVTNHLDTKISSITSDLGKKVASDLTKKVSTITSEIVEKKVSNMASEIDKKVSTIASEIDSKVSGVTSQLDDKISNMTSDLDKRVVSDLNKRVASMVAEVKASAATTHTEDNGNNGNNGTHLTLDQFKMEFDRTVSEIPTSIGWVEMAMIRERVCDKYSISKQNFYSLASQLFNQYNNRYELSSGGNEGVMVRGLVHGFVRCI